MTEGELAKGNFVAPTVFADVDNSWRIAQEEIFGPVQVVVPFDTVDEAIALANANRYGLAGMVWTTNLNTAQALAAGGLERIRNQPIPLPYAAFVRGVAWFFGIMVCTRLDNTGHDTVVGIAVGILIMTLFIVAERLGHFIEEPMSNTPFDLPMNRFCAGITADLLGSRHPLARMPDGDDAAVWM